MIKRKSGTEPPSIKTPAVEVKEEKKIGRPPLTEKQRAERDAKKKGDTRDSVRIYLTPLQYAYLKDYHSQGGHLPGETIRLAVDHYMKWLIDNEQYEPSDAAKPKAAQRAWEIRQGITKAHTALLTKLSGEHPDVDYSDEFPPPKEIIH